MTVVCELLEYCWRSAVKQKKQLGLAHMKSDAAISHPEQADFNADGNLHTDSRPYHISYTQERN